MTVADFFPGPRSAGGLGRSGGGPRGDTRVAPPPPGVGTDGRGLGGTIRLEGGAPGAGVPGGARFPAPAENAATLSGNQVGRWGPTERFNLWSLIGSSTATANWTAITVDRPTLLIPTAQLFGSVHYVPYNIPNGAGVADPRYFAQKAFGPGVVYLWAPGTWYVKYSANGIAATFRQIAAEDPGIVAAALALPGCQRISTALVTVTDAAGVQIAASNPFRTSLFITGLNDGTYTPIISTNIPLGISLGYSAAATLLTTASYALNNLNASLELSGPAMFAGIVTGIMGVTGNAKFIVQERE